MLALPINPVVPGPGTGKGGTVIVDPEAAAWGSLFNMRYRMLLSYLAHSFQLAGTPGESQAPGRRGNVVNRVYGEMYNLRSIAGIIIRRPLDKDPAIPAGPPFQMPYTLQFPPMEPDFWRLHLDLLIASREWLASLERLTRGDGLAYARALMKADHEAMREIETILRHGGV